MEELLTEIQSKLQIDISDIRKQDIYITPAIFWVPDQIKIPCIGIKDGHIKRKDLAGGMQEVTLNVHIIILISIFKGEAAIIGTNSRKGILRHAKDIEESLLESYAASFLGIDGMINCDLVAEKETEYFGSRGNDQNSLGRKIMTYEYIKEVSKYA